ncbi:MAG: tandem-95 repeat protein, partial [Gammaproteobacteria bacterium]|nr:tandem-95 repeat protein [Gammaproteobacteria bacterium]
VNGTTYTATNNGDGTWTLADDTIAPALADGAYDVSVTATDGVGNVGTDASIDELVVDTTAPVVTVTGLTTADNTPALTGTVSDPTATVQVTVNGTTYAATNNGDGTWTLADDTIAPALAKGTYDVSVTATDGVGNVGTDASVDELVIQNSPPIATDDAYTTDEDLAFTAVLGVDDLLLNDSDPDGDPLTVNTTPVSGPTNGALILNSDGTFTYTPNANFNGTDSFVYEISDGDGGTAQATVTLTVNPINDPPTAVGDSYVTNEDQSVVALLGVDDLLMNDSDPEGDPLTVNTTPVALPTNGSLILNNDGTFTYTPDPDFSGMDSFIYEVLDGNGGTSQATVTIVVNPVNDAPTTTGIADVTVNEDALDTIINLVASFDDVEDGSGGLNFAVMQNTNPALFGSTNVDNVAGTLTLDYAADAFGTADLTVRATDSNGAWVEATFTVTVNPVNDAPVIAAENISVDEDVSFVAMLGVDDLLLNDSDVDGDALSVNTTPVAGPGNGSVLLNSDGTFTYTPNANFNGSDSFIYEVTDGNGGSGQGVVNITINPINDLPVAAGEAMAVDEDAALSGVPGVNDLLLNDTDVDGDPLSVSTTPVTSPANGTLVLNSDGTFTYTPNANFNGADSFAYQITDGNGGTSQAIVNISVNPVNDAPIAGSDAMSVVGGVATSFSDVSLLANDADVDGDALSIVGFTQPADGTLVQNPDGSFTYTPSNGFAGVDSFSYTVADASGAQDTVMVLINVTPPVDPGPDPDPGPGPDDGGGTTDDDQDSDDPADNDTGDEGSTGGTGDTDDPEAPPAEDGGGGGAREANPGSPAEPGIWSEYLGIYGPDGADRNVIASATPAKYLYDALQLMDRTFEIEVPDFALANSTYVPIWQALDAMKREMRNPDGDEFGGVMVLQMATGTSVALSAGFVAWILRGGALASALMSVLPMWQGFDPLPILMARKRRKKAAQQKDLQDAEILRESEVDRLFEAATKAGLLHRSKESS